MTKNPSLTQKRHFYFNHIVCVLIFVNFCLFLLYSITLFYYDGYYYKFISIFI